MKKNIILIVCIFMICCGCTKKEKAKEEKCLAKKFEQSYSYAYKTEDECLINGSYALYHTARDADSNVFEFGCEKIVDDCNDIWYGVYYYVYDVDGSINKVYY